MFSLGENKNPVDNNHTVLGVVGLQLSPSTGSVYIYKSIQHMDECVREKSDGGEENPFTPHLPPPPIKRNQERGEREKESSNSERNPLSIVTHK
jgi:hypothetical protein